MEVEARYTGQIGKFPAILRIRKCATQVAFRLSVTFPIAFKSPRLLYELITSLGDLELI